MGCGASQSDVIRSVVPKNNGEEMKSKGEVMNGTSKPMANNSNGNGSTLSNSSTIPATDFYQETLAGAPANDYLKPLPRNLPPLKPLRGAKSFAGFTDQNTNDLNQANRNNRIGKYFLEQSEDCIHQFCITSIPLGYRLVAPVLYFLFL